MPGESRQGVFALTLSSATAKARCRAGDRAKAARHNRCALPSPPAADASLQVLLDHMKAAEAGLKTLESRFTQTRHFVHFDQTETHAGTLVYERGKGVRLQRYKDGGISDARVFSIKDGLTWKDSAGRTFTVLKTELRDWLGERAEAGRLPPKGFPKNNRFG